MIFNAFSISADFMNEVFAPFLRRNFLMLQHIRKKSTRFR